MELSGSIAEWDSNAIENQLRSEAAKLMVGSETIHPSKIDPFSYEYDELIKLHGEDASRKFLAEEIYRKCSPKRKRQLVEDNFTKDGAIKKLIKDIDNLRAARRKKECSK